MDRMEKDLDFISLTIMICFRRHQNDSLDPLSGIDRCAIDVTYTGNFNISNISMFIKIKDIGVCI